LQPAHASVNAIALSSRAVSIHTAPSFIQDVSMPQFDMKIVPAEAVAASSVLEHTKGSPVKTGEGDETYRCGSCKTKLFVNVSHHDAHGLVVKCGKCGKINADPHH
jgi:predicted Zn finger-like uncharacterized protein